MKRKLLLICLLIISTFYVINAATIKGRIVDNKGEPLPFASLYLKGTTHGTTSNVEGYYSFEISPGKQLLVCQYVGFQKQEFEITILEGVTTKNITLVPNEKALKEVTIKSGENPAIAIIKKTIAKRSFYNKEIDAFRANAYIKGNFKLDEIPNGGMIYSLMGGGSKDEVEKSKGILMLSESVSEISYKRPDKMKINVKSSRVSGSSKSYGFSEPLFINLYDNNVEFGSQLTPRGIVSPIADAALLSYKYELLSAYMEDGKLINRIKVIPRRKYEPLFSGIIDIIENEWRLHSVDLIADKDHQLEMVDTIKVKQVFVPVKNILMVKDQSFLIKLKLMGFGITGNFVNVFSDYLFEYDEQATFNKFIKEYDKDALKKSINYWDSIRPVPLNAEEIEDFVKKDSIEKAKPDTVAKQKNSVRTIILNGISNSKKEKYSFRTSPFISLQNFNWNTVEGLNYNYKISHRKRFNDDNYITTNLRMRYGLSNQQFNAKVNSAYYFGKTNKSKLALGVGRYVFQYNNAEPVNPLINSLYTLFYGRNYLKIYQAWFGKLQYEYKHISGFTIANQIQYQMRNPLGNSNLFSFRKNNVLFTENYPTERIATYIPKHNALLYKLQMSYQPGRKYIKYPDRITATSSKYPTFKGALTFGIPTLQSDVDYAKWNLEMIDDMNLNLWGTFKYKATVGGFLYNNKSYLADYTHFNGSQIFLASPYLNSFQLSPYYLNSNTQPFYATLNAEHHFYGLLTNKIPLFRKLKWYLVASSNAYYVNQNNNYVEVSAGLENIGYKLFRIVRVDGVVGYSNFKNPVYGIRIGISSSALSFGSDDED